MKMGVQMISPDRINRIHNKQDGRRLRRYKRRHRVENFFADLQTYRRAVTRYEKIPENHLNRAFREFKPSGLNSSYAA